MANCVLNMQKAPASPSTHKFIPFICYWLEKGLRNPHDAELEAQSRCPGENLQDPDVPGRSKAHDDTLTPESQEAKHKLQALGGKDIS